MQSSVPVSHRVRECEETLRRLLTEWNSRYLSIILFQSESPRVISIDTEWSIPPTPSEPIPEIRIHVHFSFLFDTERNELGERVPLPPSLTYRIEHEELVHRDLKQNIDHHILRQIKFKTQFYRQNPLPFTKDQTEFFQTRFNQKTNQPITLQTTDAITTK